MPRFSYKAVDAKGMSYAGILEGSSRVMVVERLHQRGLIVTSVHEGDRASHSAWISWIVERTKWHRGQRQLSIAELLSSTQSLAALLKAGLTIDRALGLTANLQKRPHVRTSMAELAKSVRSGKSFADTLKDSGMQLPPYFISMVHAGEVGGSLAQCLARLTTLLHKQHEIRERIRSALIYPAILACVVALTVVLLLVFVLPRFQALFAESEARLPWPTRAVLTVGSFVSGYWWCLGLLAAVCGAAAVMFVRSSNGRRRIDAWLLRTPLMLGLPAAIDTARLLRTMSVLLSNGVPIASGIQVARNTVVNSRLREALDEAVRRIKSGESTSAALAAAAVFPAQAVQLVRVGEETGRLEELLFEAAIILEDESETTLERLLTLMVPVLTIVLGGVIAGLIGSVLLGLLSINDLAL